MCWVTALPCRVLLFIVVFAGKRLLFQKVVPEFGTIYTSALQPPFMTPGDTHDSAPYEVIATKRLLVQ